MSTPPPEINGLPGAGLASIQRWSAIECGFTIEYSVDLMDRIRRKAVESFHVLPHGGLEVGGLLFGRVYPNARAPQRIELMAERPIHCDHHNGPDFNLIDEERAQITAQLERTRLDPEIAAFSVLGFWVSHGRGELALSHSDAEIYKLFPQPWQIVLLVKPQTAQPTRATFLFREGSAICLPRTEHEFYADPGLAASPHLREAPQFSEDSASELPPPEKTTSKWRPVLFFTLAVLLGTGLTYSVQLLGKKIGATRADEIDLEVFQNANSVLIHWNAQAADIRNANRGDLVVTDGWTPTRISLTSDLLKRGFVTYNPAGGQVSAVLTVVEQDGRVENRTGRYWSLASGR